MTDEIEIPLLTDVIVKGDVMMAGKYADSSTADAASDIDAIIDAAINAALPEFRATLKQELLLNLRDRLSPED